MKSIDYVTLLNIELLSFVKFLEQDGHTVDPKFQDGNCRVPRDRSVLDWAVEHEKDVFMVNFQKWKNTKNLQCMKHLNNIKYIRKKISLIWAVNLWV